MFGTPNNIKMKKLNMKTQFRSIPTLIALGCMAALLTFGLGTVYSQGFTSANGEKIVTMNDKVNKNQFIWVSDAPLENTRGSSEAVTGTLTMNPANLSTIRGTISTQVSTMKSGNDTRDHHLKSPEWLDASRFPLISFAIASVSNVTVNGNVATGTAAGTFTMHGVTKQMSIPFKMTYVPESAKTRERAPGDLVMIAADFNISLKDYNIAGQEGTIGSKVGESIKITAQLFGNALPKSSQ
jgi:polyisoprenoid-binding protein YceI